MKGGDKMSGKEEKRWLWEWCRVPRSVCDRVNGNCNKCNAVEKRMALEKIAKRTRHIKRQLAFKDL